MPQSLSEAAPTCPKCLPLWPVPTDGPRRVRVERLLNFEAVHKALGGGTWPSTEHTHAIRVEGIKAHYKTKPTPIKCALEDRSHKPHFEGYVVQTACGMLLNVGIDCWKRWIPGMDVAEQAVRDTMRYDRNIATIKNDPLELQLALSALDKRVDGLKAAQKGLVAYLPTTVSRRMRDASESARQREVVVDVRRETEQGTRRFEERYSLRGWELWKDPPSTVQLQARLTEIVEEIEQGLAADPELNAEHERLAKRLHLLRDSLRDVEDWADPASSFFLDDNLHLVVGDTRAPARVENGGLVLEEGGERIRIDATGVTKTPLA